jgi:hydrogenase expression/formation protein HypC
MCVALPGRIISIGDPGPASIPARVSTGGSVREVDLVLVPEAEVGDYVVTHSGYAIEILPEARALETLALFDAGGF